MNISFTEYPARKNHRGSKPREEYHRPLSLTARAIDFPEVAPYLPQLHMCIPFQNSRVGKISFT